MIVNGKIGQDWLVLMLKQRLVHATELTKKISEFRAKYHRQPSNTVSCFFRVRQSYKFFIRLENWQRL